MDQMVDTGPVLVFLTICPLARCSAQAVLPKVACVTLSHRPVLHAGTPNSSGHQKGGRQRGALVCVCLSADRANTFKNTDGLNLLAMLN